MATVYINENDLYRKSLQEPDRYDTVAKKDQNYVTQESSTPRSLRLIVLIVPYH